MGIEDIRVGNIYKHYKGGYVKVVAKCKHTETMEDMIAYIHIYNSRKDNADPNLFFIKHGETTVWVRPAGMWFDKVKDDGTTRFTIINYEG